MGVLLGLLLCGTSAWAQEAPFQTPSEEPAAPPADEPRETGDNTPRLAQAPAVDSNGASPATNGVSQTDAIPLAPATGTNGAGTYSNAGRATLPARRAVLEARLRELMGQMGIVSPPTQDAILAFMSADEEGKRQVREAGRKLLVGIRRDSPPERLKALLSEYQGAIESERLRRERAQTALDAQVGYSLDARLESPLWLLGVLGRGQSAFGLGAFGPGDAQSKRAGSAEVQASEIAGTITAKSGASENPAWLEIRDEGGHLWRLKPDAAPAARQVIGRQISALPLGAHITARVGTPVPIPVLLAIIPDDADQNPVLAP